MLTLKNIFKTKITFYDKCENMPLYDFQMYLKTNDLRYFTKEFKHHKSLNDVMNAFFAEYLELTKNQKVVQRFGLMFKIMRLTAKYNTVMLLLKTLYNFPKNGNITHFEELIHQLDKWNYRIDRSKDVFEQLEKISNRVQGIKTQLDLLNDELKEDDKGEATTIESQLISVSRCLDLGYRLNPKEITVLEWHEYQEQAKKLLREREKQQSKRK